MKSIEEKILDFIEKKESCNYSKISRELNIHKNTVSDICKHLEKQKKITIKKEIGIQNILRLK